MMDFENSKCDNCGHKFNREECVNLEAGHLWFYDYIYTTFGGKSLYDFEKLSGKHFCSFACIVQYLCNDLLQTLKEYEANQ